MYGVEVVGRQGEGGWSWSQDQEVRRPSSSNSSSTLVTSYTAFVKFYFKYRFLVYTYTERYIVRGKVYETYLSV